MPVMTVPAANHRTPIVGMLVALLPGPDRKRSPRQYRYRMLYRHTDPREPGCAMVWEVIGGREPYQVTLERLPNSKYRWHCSCADAVYQGDRKPGHTCKHIRGIQACLPTLELSDERPPG
ncbi:hypothetical protein [Tuwongella immobilis]|uniref:E3 ubiquitin-protein ligase dtx4 isoform x2 n=1 Tax=Tuwongella immobilis TaxID=692036 RepID=A0A6C2YLF8_9BACT|nr:hypothetical protein [Tuwongella immobilis]VIP02214.1 e3 ubiquitin-protein ligase dtx4 isoform x2 : [Tuwongella immobilis]VTS00729.1 e3 ubiquitin-protein ligase dtx4 isoform x2 : [Tuwongella immobilis]